jgi:hypothetical protein
LDGLSSQLDDLKRELYEYETLRSGKRRFIALESIEELPKTLFQAALPPDLARRNCRQAWPEAAADPTL